MPSTDEGSVTLGIGHLKSGNHTAARFLSQSSGKREGTLAVSLFARVIEVCDRFEVEFRQGQAPRIEDHLIDSNDSIRPALLRELIALELEMRRGKGERPDPDEYRGRFSPDAVDRAFQTEATQFEETESDSAGPKRPHPVGRTIPRPTIAGYEILEELGRGAMGVVYKARENRLNRLCALKMILAGDLAGPVTGLRFLAEAEAVARLQHPGIVQIYGIGDHEGYPYLELEFVEGGTLSGSIAGMPRPARAAAKLVEAVALAVGEAHRRGIVHRDLKPGNILLTADGRPKVADFGLAKSLDFDGDGLTQTDSVLGTPSYMAPEQAEGRTKDAGPAADIYSLGAIFYEMLTGRPPFRAPTILQTLEQVKNADPVPPTRLQPGLSRDAETICLTCLQKDPARRYASAEALAEDLRRFQAREPIRARRVGTVEVALRWCRRRPAIAGLLAALVVSNTVGFVVVVTFWQSSEIHRVHAIESSFRAEDRRIAADRSTEEARKETRLAHVESATLALERGVRNCDDGEIGRGLVWLARSLDRAPADATGLRWAIRAKMAHWRLGLTSLDRVIGHPSEVNIARYSPDGSRIVTGMGLYYSDRPQSAWLLDGVTGQAVGPPLEHGLAVMDAVFSPDGRIVYTLSMDRSTRAWNTATGQLIRVVATNPINPKEAIWGEDLALSPDGRTIVISEGKIARIRRVETGEVIGEPMVHELGILDLEWSPDGKRIASACKDGSVSLWDASTGTAVRKIQVPGGGYIYSATFSPDGLRLMVAGSAQVHHVFQVDTGKMIPSPAAQPHRGTVFASAFHPAGRLIATGGSDSEVRMTDQATGRAVGQPLTQVSGLWSVSFAPGGRTLLTSGEDKTVRLYSLPEGYAPARSLPHGHSITAAAFSPDGGREILTSDGDGLARRWSASDGQPVGPISWPRGKVHQVRYRPDNRAFLTVGGFSARLWDLASGAPLPGSAPLFQFTLGHHNGILCSAFTRDNKVVLTGGTDHTVQRWDAATGRSLGTLIETTDSVNALALTPDGKEILTGDWSGHIQRWNLATGRPIGKPIQHGNKVNDLAVNPSGTLLLSCGEVGVAQLWRIDGMKRVGPAMRHRTVINRAIFSPDGQMIATASDDATARLWDVETSTPLGPPIHHNAQVTDLDFRPDGRSLLTVTRDGAIHVWDLPEVPEDNPARLKSWSQVASGLGMDEDGVIRPLDADDWRQCASDLEAAGGSPFPVLDRRRTDPARDLWKAIEAAEANDLFASRWHLDRYLASPSRDGRDDSSILLSLGDAMHARNDAGSALKVFREALRQRPDSPEAHFHLGLTLLAIPDHGKAVAAAEIREMTRFRPDHAEIQWMMGIGLWKVGDREGAIQAMRKALDLRPALVIARLNLAHFLMDRRTSRGNSSPIGLAATWQPGFALIPIGFERAERSGLTNRVPVEFFREICRWFPGSAPARVRLGRALSRSGAHDRAIAAFEAAIRLDPDSVGGHAALAREFEIRESPGQETPATIARLLRSIAQQYPGEIHALMNLGELLKNQNDIAGSARAFREATLIRPDDRDAHSRLAATLETLGDFPGALDQHDRAVGSAPGDAEAYNQRAWFLTTCPDPRFRNGKRAIADAHRAVDLTHGENPSNLNTLAAALAESGNFLEAVKYQAQAVSLDHRAEFEKRLSLYKKSIPDHDPAPTVRR